jgi:tetratricopeptide (TPR) repeat protein
MELRVRLTLTALLTLAAGYCEGQTPQPTACQREAALALERQGDNAAAETAWKQCLESNPSNPEAYAQMGLLEARQEHYKEAVPLYRRALELGPEIPSVKLNLGLALFKSGELKQSIEIFTELLNSQPPDSRQTMKLKTLLGMAHYGLGEYADAIPYLKDAAAADEQNLALKLVLAHSCLRVRQNQCVLDVYHEILTLDPNSAEAYMLAGEALDAMKDRAGAIQEFRAAIRANPKEPGVHLNLGYVLWAQSQFREAEPEFQAELDNSPNDAQAMTYLADAEVHLNQPEAARMLLENAAKIEPGIALIHLDLGIVYSDAGRRDDAVRELKLAETLDPDNQNVHWRLGHIYQIEGNKDEAKAEFDKLHSLKNAVEDALGKKLIEAETKDKPAAEAPAAPNVK